MLYHVLGKEIEITDMTKPANYGSIYEFNGDNNALEEIGLKRKFFYTTAGIGRFTNELLPQTDTCDLWEPKNPFQYVLSIFLCKSILNGKLTNQFETPHV